MQNVIKSMQVIGQVVKYNNQLKSVQVRVPQMKLDEFLLMVNHIKYPFSFIFNLTLLKKYLSFDIY